MKPCVMRSPAWPASERPAPVRRRALLARSVHPLVLLPGDNEWTDCHRLGAGGHDPRADFGAFGLALWLAAGRGA